MPTARGEAQNQSDLTEDDVRAIRHLRAMGCDKCGARPTLKEIGGLFGISGVAIYKIVSRKSWAHVE